MVDLEEARRLANRLQPIPTTHLGLYRIQVSNAKAAMEALITEVENQREELTEYHKQDNQEHRLIAKIEILEGQNETLNEEVEKLRELVEWTRKAENLIMGSAPLHWINNKEPSMEEIEYAYQWEKDASKLLGKLRTKIKG